MGARDRSLGAAVEVFPDAEGVARRAAEALIEAVAAAAAEGRRASVALSGGSTPKRLFALLAGELRSRIEWPRLEVFFGDERAVPPEHPDSNYRSAREGLLARVDIPASQVHRLAAEQEDLDAAAQSYERLMRERVGLGDHGLPRLDLIWLGMGEDGHTASLFPGTRALAETRRWVVGNDVPQLQTRRLTLTFPALSAARRVQFLVTGGGKAAVAAAILEPPGGKAPDYPAARVRPAGGRLEWLLDAAAAARLKRGS